MRPLRLALAASLAALLAPVVGQAATLDLTGAVGAAIASGTSSTATYSGDSAFGDVTFVANPTGSDLTSSSSGLGIDCVGWTLACRVDATDQIDPGEVLAISFSTPKFVTSVGISQLTSGMRFNMVLQDIGVVAGDGFLVPFTASQADAGGNLSVDVGHWASAIYFVPILGSYDGFSVASLSIDESVLPASSLGSPSSPIPEPSSVLMMTIGGALVLLSIRKVAV